MNERTAQRARLWPRRARRVGRRGYHRLAPFQQEGYADYAAFARPGDLAAGRDALARDAPEMGPRRSGCTGATS